MKKLFLKKLKSQLGETLVETLFAILIATFASILLAGATSTAIELNRQARARDAVNELCLEKLATEADVKVEEDAHIVIQPMQMDTDTGKLVKKTDGTSRSLPRRSRWIIPAVRSTTRALSAISARISCTWKHPVRKEAE